MENKKINDFSSNELEEMFDSFNLKSPKKKVNKKKVNRDGLDKYYTKISVAKSCFQKTLEKANKNNIKYDFFLEPSAGDGAFYNIFPTDKRIGIDIDPKSDNIIKKDFFKYSAPVDKTIITCGNPPFGKNASLAIKFFNHAATFSNMIAFIVPKSFKKDSIKNKLDLGFWLIYEKDLPKKTFIIDGNEWDVPCCFQIWIKKINKRKKTKYDIKNDFFEFVKKWENPDISVRRVGGSTGKASDNLDVCETSHYFLKIKDKSINKLDLINRINKADIFEIRCATAGVRSVSKPEIVRAIIRVKE